MTSKIEETKREMYRALAALKSGGRWLLKKANAEAFESALEAHLEEVRRQLLFAEEAHKYNAVLWDAYELQKKLTHEACCRERLLTDHLSEETRIRVMADRDCGQAQQIVDQQKERIHQQSVLIAAQRQAIGQMYMLKKTMSNQIAGLIDENDLLRTAARVAGEELRSRKIASYFAINSDLIKFAKPHQCEVFVNGGCTGCGRRLVEEA